MGRGGALQVKFSTHYWFLSCNKLRSGRNSQTKSQKPNQKPGRFKSSSKMP